MTSLQHLSDKEKPPSDADAVVKDANDKTMQGDDEKIQDTNSIEELKQLTNLISIKLTENTKKSSKMKSIFSFRMTVPIRSHILPPRYIRDPDQRHPTTFWQKFRRFWSTACLRRMQRRIRRRRRRIVLQILQIQNNIHNRPHSRILPVFSRIWEGLAKLLRLRRAYRVAPEGQINQVVAPGVTIGTHAHDPMVQPTPNGSSTVGNAFSSTTHGSTLRRRTQLIELLNVNNNVTVFI